MREDQPQTWLGQATDDMASLAEDVAEQPTLVPLAQRCELVALSGLSELSARAQLPGSSEPVLIQAVEAIPTRPLRRRRVERVLLIPRPAALFQPASRLASRQSLGRSVSLAPVAASAAAVWRGIRASGSALATAQAQRLAAYLRPRRLALAVWAAGVLLAITAGLLFVGAGVDQAISDEMVSVGFDAERGHMIAAFCLALLAAGASGVVVLRRGAAWLGGIAAFALSYLWPFYLQAQRPMIGPDGRPLTPIAGTLDHIVLVLGALSVVFAGTGAVLGEACGQLISPPLVALARHLVAALRIRRRPDDLASLAVVVRRMMAGALVALALAIGVPELSGLLTFGIGPQLYQPAQGLAPTVRGTVEQGEYVSLALGGVTRHFSIYLPPFYSSVADAEQRYPVTYLLHGSPGGATDWFSAAHAADIADTLSIGRIARQSIIVCPDGNGPVYHTSAWVNSYDNRQRMEDAIATDLVGYIDSHYRTIPDAADRAIGGLSEGGFGAVNIALHRPDVFSKVMSLDGFYQIDSNAPAFGHSKGSEGYQHYNSPVAYLQSPQGQKAGHRLRFVIAVGKQDYFYKSGLSFVQELNKYGMSVEVIQTDGGHSWVQWGQQFGEALPALLPITQERRTPRGPN